MDIIKLLLIFSTVIVTLLTAILLNYAAKNSVLFSILGLGAILIVISINFIKFKTWGYIYQRYHLSESYPLVALFFPLIYMVAIYNNEAEFEWSKMTGIFLIIIGIFIMNKKKVL